MDIHRNLIPPFISNTSMVHGPKHIVSSPTSTMVSRWAGLGSISRPKKWAACAWNFTTIGIFRGVLKRRNWKWSKIRPKVRIETHGDFGIPRRKGEDRGCKTTSHPRFAVLFFSKTLPMVNPPLAESIGDYLVGSKFGGNVWWIFTNVPAARHEVEE